MSTRTCRCRRSCGCTPGTTDRPRDVDEVIGLVGLGEKAPSRVKTLSGGQQRRLDVALGLIGDPELLFLDEPTTGFDPSARRQAWEVIAELTKLGKTVLLTTHYMEEAQVLADRVIVMAAGVIVAEGTPESIGGRADAVTTIEFVLPAGPRSATFRCRSTTTAAAASCDSPRRSRHRRFTS